MYAGHKYIHYLAQFRFASWVLENEQVLTAVGLRGAPVFGAERIKQTFFRKLFSGRLSIYGQDRN